MTEEVIAVGPDWAKRAYVDEAKYKAMYEASVRDPAKFWDEHGNRIDWIKPYSPAAVRDVDYTGNVRIRWFHDGVLNVSANCVDRHFLDQLMLLARENGWHTCRQVAFSSYQHVVRRELKIPEDQVVICGLALGKADPDEAPNNLITARAPIQDFTTWFNE